MKPLEHIVESNWAGGAIKQACLAGTMTHNRLVAEFDVPSRAEMLSHLRACVVEFASSMPFTVDELEDIRLATGEAAVNAMQHGTPSAHCRIAVRVENHGDYLKVIVSDKGCGFKHLCSDKRSYNPLAEHGRGIMCMRAVMDQVTFKRLRPGMRVEMTKKVHSYPS